MRVFLLCLFLVGCATTPAPVEIPTVVEVQVPVAVKCAAEVAAPSFLADAKLFAMSEYAFVLALWRDRIDRQAYENQLTAALTGCK